MWEHLSGVLAAAGDVDSGKEDSQRPELGGAWVQVPGGPAQNLAPGAQSRPPSGPLCPPLSSTERHKAKPDRKKQPGPRFGLGCAGDFWRWGSLSSLRGTGRRVGCPSGLRGRGEPQIMGGKGGRDLMGFESFTQEERCLSPNWGTLGWNGAAHVRGRGPGLCWPMSTVH